jgi:hypothetical protein
VRALRAVFLSLLGALCLLQPARAWANGRYPAADHLVINPSDPRHMLLRTSYGFVQTVDGGDTWHWFCEGAMNPPSDDDPALELLGDGTIIVQVLRPPYGIATSRDRGCTWESTPALFADRIVRDMTQNPTDPAGALVLASRYENDGGRDTQVAFVAETKDNARTWTKLGTNLPNPDLAVHSLEVARSDPNRIYVSGVHQRTGAFMLMRTENRGTSWAATAIPAPAWDAGHLDSVAYIGAVDPTNADRVYVRVLRDYYEPDRSPGALLVSSDKGRTWRELAQSSGPMLGLALSPDGTKLAYGTSSGLFDDKNAILPGGAVYVGPPLGPFAKVNTQQNRCLKWTAASLYACGTEGILGAYDPFTVGSSSDDGATFKPKYTRATTCHLACAAGTQVANVCPSEWPAARDRMCPWPDGSPHPECRCAGDGGTDAQTSKNEDSSDCACRSAGSLRRFDPMAIAIASLSLVVVSMRRRRKL